MKIEERKITIKELYVGYYNNNQQEDSVWAYDKKLNVRPAFQRNFVYDDYKQKLVINSIYKGFPINIMYFSKVEEDKYEVLDGQQRIISICSFLGGKFSIQINNHTYYFDTLTKNEQEKILNYKLNIYICEGTEKEKIDWFKIINIAGVVLDEQEIRNAVYSSKFVLDLRSYFSKINGAGDNLRKNIIEADVNRQALLEKVLNGFRKYKNLKSIEDVMALGKVENNAEEIKTYFNNMINWIKHIFKETNKHFLKVDWFSLYNEYGELNNTTDPMEIQKKVNQLLADEEVKAKHGIYAYIFDGKESHLSLRTFDEGDKTSIYNQQKGLCKKCSLKIPYEKAQADHIIPWSKGGKSKIDNLQILCQFCNNTKSNK